MPVVNIQITEAKRTKNNITFTAVQSDNVITREVDIGEFDTWQKFAQWVINQEPDFVLMPDKQKSLNITFHIETATDPVTGVVSTIRVVDGVVAT